MDQHTNRIAQYLDPQPEADTVGVVEPIGSPRDIEEAAATLHEMLEAFADGLEDAESEMGAFVLDMLADDLAELAGVLADADPELIEKMDAESLRITRFIPPAGSTAAELEDALDEIERTDAHDPRFGDDDRGFFARIRDLG